MYYYFRGRVFSKKKIGINVCTCLKKTMLKDKTTESKKLFEAEHTSNRITQHSYNNTPCTLVKANNDSNQNTVYKIPEVHIFFKYNFLFLIIRYVKNLNLFFDF